jgi:hypothetical protein
MNETLLPLTNLKQTFPNKNIVFDSIIAMVTSPKEMSDKQRSGFVRLFLKDSNLQAYNVLQNDVLLL